MMAALLAVGLPVGCTRAPPETVGLGCPQVGIIRDASRVERFRAGSGREPQDVLARAEIERFIGRCEYERGLVVVELDLLLSAWRGPALTGVPALADYQYFVAITDPQRNILARVEMPVRFTWAGASDKASIVEPLSQRIPLQPGVDGRAYEILVGLIMTPDELSRNRTRFGPQ